MSSFDGHSSGKKKLDVVSYPRKKKNGLLHRLLEKFPASYKYLITALGNESSAAALTVKNLILVPVLAFQLTMGKILPFCAKNHL